ncbi:MAG: NnrU family protein [Silicimonas sp.]|nr:NnrU family protein [Silicimonas sp.]
MTLLIAGLALWIAAHVFKRLAPEARAGLTEKMGEGSKGLIAALILLSVILMVFGYKAADGAFWWGRSAPLVGINNLLMLLSVYLFAASGAKTRITRVIKNPQLTAFKAWALAHLLVNGDLPSFILFGGLLGWAVWEVILLKRAGVTPEPAPDVPMKKEITTAIAALVVYVIIGLIHQWLGYPPFGA